MKQISKYLYFFRDAWLILGISIFLFLVIELSLSLIVPPVGNPVSDQVSDSRALADTYGDSIWQTQYYKEFHEANKSRWEPYVYWRRQAYSGNYINIGDDGLRTASRKENLVEKSDRITKIFMFGGSTIWGTGARDEFTIPAILEKLIEKGTGTDLEMTNFGQSGYVSTQEVILLIRHLQSGNIPDLAVFYDGVNDTYSAYQQNIAGLPQNEHNRVKEFGLFYKKDLIQEIAAKNFLYNLTTVRIAKYAYKKIMTATPKDKDDDNDKMNDNQDLKKLVNDEIRIYQNNIRIVNELSEEYGFKYIFYWQPSIFQKQPLTTYETQELERQHDAMKFYNTAYSTMKKITPIMQEKYNFENISDIFSNTKDPLYIDYCHLGETGNRLIAERMLQDVYPLVDAKTLSPKSSPYDD